MKILTVIVEECPVCLSKSGKSVKLEKTQDWDVHGDVQLECPECDEVFLIKHE